MTREVLPDPSEIADSILTRSGQQQPPTDLDRVISLWSGTYIRRDALDGPGYLLDLGIHGAEILVREADPPARQRYTAAHELGHLVLKPYLNDSKSDHDPKVEKWCDRFARELLMPEGWIRERLLVSETMDLLHSIWSGPADFGVSSYAFCLRVSETSPVSVMRVRQQNGKTEILASFFPENLDSEHHDAFEQGIRSMSIKMLTPGLDGPFMFSVRGVEGAIALLRGKGADREWLSCGVPRSWLRVPESA